jgi:hypothetical protein
MPELLRISLLPCPRQNACRTRVAFHNIGPPARGHRRRRPAAASKPDSGGVGGASRPAHTTRHPQNRVNIKVLTRRLCHHKIVDMTTGTANANDIAQAVYRASDIDLKWTETPDGIEILTLPDGYSITISHDGGGISWWEHSPEERGIESGGWSDDDARLWGCNGNTWSIDREVAALVDKIAILARR